MKKQKKTKNNEKQTKNRTVYIGTNINTCIACGREIPEGMLVCIECEIGTSTKRCTICDRPIEEGDSICQRCRDIIFNSTKKD